MQYNIGDEVEFWNCKDDSLLQGIICGKYDFQQYLIRMDNKKELIVKSIDIKSLVGDLTKTTEYYNDR